MVCGLGCSVRWKLGARANRRGAAALVARAGEMDVEG